VVTVIEERLGKRRADAARAAGDQDVLAFDAEVRCE